MTPEAHGVIGGWMGQRSLMRGSVDYVECGVWSVENGEWKFGFLAGTMPGVIDPTK